MKVYFMKTKNDRRTVICWKAFFIFLCVLASARTAAGTSVIVWGYSYNGNGSTNVPVGLTNAIAIATGGWHAMALKSDGRVLEWGLLLPSEVPPWLADAKAIAAGADDNGLAIRSNGTLVVWGGNDYGVSTPPAGLNDIMAIGAGYVHSLAVRSNGTVVAWGDNSSGDRKSVV